MPFPKIMDLIYTNTMTMIQLGWLHHTKNPCWWQSSSCIVSSRWSVKKSWVQVPLNVCLTYRSKKKKKKSSCIVQTFHCRSVVQSSFTKSNLHWGFWGAQGYYCWNPRDLLTFLTSWSALTNRQAVFLTHNTATINYHRKITLLTTS